jgi:hypothetical protein
MSVRQGDTAFFQRHKQLRPLFFFSVVLSPDYMVASHLKHLDRVLR